MQLRLAAVAGAQLHMAAPTSDGVRTVGVRMNARSDVDAGVRLWRRCFVADDRFQDELSFRGEPVRAVEAFDQVEGLCWGGDAQFPGEQAQVLAVGLQACGGGFIANRYSGEATPTCKPGAVKLAVPSTGGLLSGSSPLTLSLSQFSGSPWSRARAAACW